MKANYFKKQAIALVALFGCATMFAQTVKNPTFTELRNPVVGAPYPEKPEIVADSETGRFPFGFTYESAAAFADYNNDGFMDLVTSGTGHGWSKQTFLYQGHGDGTFTYIEDAPFPNLAAASLAWFDYDNDGNLDLFLAGQADGSNYSGLWRNLGADGNYEFEEVCIAEFEYISNEGGNRNNRYVVAADYDNDGWVDLYIQGHTGAGRFSALYKNVENPEGGRSFEEVESPVIGNTVVVGSTTFIQMNAGGAIWGDYNNDGFLDLISNGYFQGFTNPDFDENLPEGEEGNDRFVNGGYIYAIYKNNGDGTLTLDSYYNKKGSEGDAVWVDYNNDGWLDYMIAGKTHNGEDWTDIFAIYENNQDGTFSLASASPDNEVPARGETSIVWGDLNSDGFIDMLYMNAGPNSLFLNNYMDGTFTKQELIHTVFHDDGTPDLDDEGVQKNTMNQWGGSACLVDIDNDGDLDAFTAAYGYNPVLQRNDGVEGVTNQAPSLPTNLKAATVDGVTTFTWDASTDDISDVVYYNLYVKYEKDGKDVIISVLPADLTTGRLKVNETLAPLTTTFYTLNGLPEDYTWGVQAIDNAKIASLFAIAGDEVGIPTVTSNSVSIANIDNAFRINADSRLVGTINVYSVSGMNLFTKTGQINNTEVNLSAGAYIVKVTSPEGTVAKKVVIK